MKQSLQEFMQDCNLNILQQKSNGNQAENANIKEQMTPSIPFDIFQVSMNYLIEDNETNQEQDELENKKLNLKHHKADMQNNQIQVNSCQLKNSKDLERILSINGSMGSHASSFIKLKSLIENESDHVNQKQKIHFKRIDLNNPKLKLEGKDINSNNSNTNLTASYVLKNKAKRMISQENNKILIQNQKTKVNSFIMQQNGQDQLLDIKNNNMNKQTQLIPVQYNEDEQQYQQIKQQDKQEEQEKQIMTEGDENLHQIKVMDDFNVNTQKKRIQTATQQSRSNQLHINQIQMPQQNKTFEINTKRVLEQGLQRPTVQLDSKIYKRVKSGQQRRTHIGFTHSSRAQQAQQNYFKNQSKTKTYLENQQFKELDNQFQSEKLTANSHTQLKEFYKTDVAGFYKQSDEIKKQKQQCNQFQNQQYPAIVHHNNLMLPQFIGNKQKQDLINAYNYHDKNYKYSLLPKIKGIDKQKQ